MISDNTDPPIPQTTLTTLTTPSGLVGEETGVMTTKHELDDNNNPHVVKSVVGFLILSLRPLYLSFVIGQMN